MHLIQYISDMRFTTLDPLTVIGGSFSLSSIVVKMQSISSSCHVWEVPTDIRVLLPLVLIQQLMLVSPFSRDDKGQDGSLSQLCYLHMIILQHLMDISLAPC